jgi:predicted nucleic acid-binding protein
MFLLDTDTCIDVLRGVKRVAQKLEQLSPDDCCVSTSANLAVSSR